MLKRNLLKVSILLCGLSAISSSWATELIMLKRVKNPPADINDAVRINAAIEQVNAAGGGVVLLAGGTYHVASPINVLSNVTLKGRGGSKVRLVDNAPSFAGTAGIIRMLDDRTKTPVTNAAVQDIVIDGNRDMQTQGIGDAEKKFCLYAEGDNLTISRVVAKNCMGYGFNPHGKRTASGTRVPSTNITIEDSVAKNNLIDGFTIDQIENSTFRSNIARENGRHGYNIISDSTNLKVINNVSRLNGANGIMVQNGAHTLTLANNKIKRNTESGMMIRASDNNTIDGNLIHNNGYEAVKLRGSSNNQLSDNTLFNNSKSERRTYYEVKLEDYNGAASTANNVYTNIIVSHRSVGIVYEKGNSDNNQYYDNGYRTKVGAFNLIGGNSQEYNNRPALEE